MALGALIHFRTNIGSERRAEGFKGGYCQFLGLHTEWKDFIAAVDDHLASLGCFRMEVDDRIEITGRDEIDDGEVREMFDNLTTYPLQYGNHYFYENDDA